MRSADLFQRRMRSSRSTKLTPSLRLSMMARQSQGSIGFMLWGWSAGVGGDWESAGMGQEPLGGGGSSARGVLRWRERPDVLVS